MKWLEVPLTLMDSVMKFDGAGMNESPMSSEADVEEVVAAVDLEREVAAMNGSFTSSGRSDDAPVVVVDVQHDDAVIVAAVLAGENGDVGCSADPCSGDDVRGACSVYSLDRDDFSVPG